MNNVINVLEHYKIYNLHIVENNRDKKMDNI